MYQKKKNNNKTFNNSYLTLGLGDGCGLAAGFGKIFWCGFNFIIFCWSVAVAAAVCNGLASNWLLCMICMTGNPCGGCGVGGFKLGDGDFKLAGDEYGDWG